MKINGRQTTDDGRRTPSDAKSSHCLWQGDLKRQKDKQRSTKHTLNLSIEKKYQCSCIPFGGTRVYIRFLWGSCCSIFNFLCIVLWIVVFLFVSFLLAIILSVPLPLTASDYTPPSPPFKAVNIFKPFFGLCKNQAQTPRISELFLFVPHPSHSLTRNKIYAKTL